MGYKWIVYFAQFSQRSCDSDKLSERPLWPGTRRDKENFTAENIFLIKKLFKSQLLFLFRLMVVDSCQKTTV